MIERASEWAASVSEHASIGPEALRGCLRARWPSRPQPKSPKRVFEARVTAYADRSQPDAEAAAVVVEDHDAPARGPVPGAAEDVLGRLVDVDVDVTEADARAVDRRARLLGKDAL